MHFRWAFGDAGGQNYIGGLGPLCYLLVAALRLLLTLLSRVFENYFCLVAVSKTWLLSKLGFKPVVMYFMRSCDT